MTNVIPWHSDLDRDIGLFLAESRELSPNDRLSGVYERILSVDLDPKTLLHYAACMFIFRDGLLVETNRLPQRLTSTMVGTKEVADLLTKQQKSKMGKHAADALHDKPGGSREKSDEIRLMWASGKYSSRDICAEQEWAALDMSFSTARKPLRNTPKPPSHCTA